VSDILFSGPLAGAGSTENRAGQTAKSYSGFAQGQLEIVDGTELTLGVRYTTEDRSLIGSVSNFDATGAQTSATFFDGAPGSTTTFNKTTVRVAINHAFTDAIMGYVSYNTGFRSGGFNAGALGVPYAPETVDAYEAGLKTDLIPGVLRLNVSAFQYDYKNIQFFKFVNGQAAIQSGPEADIYGGEVELEASVSERLKLTAGLAATHHEFTDYPDAEFYVGCPVPGAPCTRSAKGNKIPYAPSFTGNVGVDYRMPLANGSQVGANVNTYYNEGYVTDPGHTLEQDAFELVNASLRWTNSSENLSATIWGRNLSDSQPASELSYANTGTVRLTYAPRTYGMTIDYQF
jgi:iron complex outermembrane receptor protein